MYMEWKEIKPPMSFLPVPERVSANPASVTSLTSVLAPNLSASSGIVPA